MKRGTPMSNSESRKRHTAENDAPRRDVIDRLLSFACRIECRLRGHNPVVTRLAGIDLSGPTCLACGRVIPPEVSAS